tara:strand:- start:4 stop:738 length:735 start_codon:yes stop_codon:yes gene_type:complete
MVFSIQEFKSALYTQESANTGRFETLILCPKIFNNENARYVSMRCESIQYPARTILSAPDENIYGPAREIPQGLVQFAEVSASFFCNVDLSEKVFFEEWQKRIYEPGTYNMQYYNDIVGEIHIFQLSKGSNFRLPGNFLSFSGAKEKKSSYGIKLYEAYPKSINAQELSVGSEDLQKVTISFAYRYWERIGAEPSTNLDDYVSASATGKYDLVNPKGILTDILGKAGASPTVTVGARAAADLIL